MMVPCYVNCSVSIALVRNRSNIKLGEFKINQKYLAK